MFKEYTQFYIQNIQSFKNRGLAYSINSNRKRIGTVQETEESFNNTGNQLIRLTTSFISARINAERLHLEVADEEGTRMGSIRKEFGLEKDLILFDQDGSQLATVISTVKMKSPALTVLDSQGNEYLNAAGTYGATDFTVADNNGKLVSSIKKRSLVYETIKDNLLNNDVYHIDNSNHEVTFGLIGIAVAIDLYFQEG